MSELCIKCRTAPGGLSSITSDNLKPGGLSVTGGVVPCVPCLGVGAGMTDSVREGNPMDPGVQQLETALEPIGEWGSERGKERTDVSSQVLRMGMISGKLDWLWPVASNPAVTSLAGR